MPVRTLHLPAEGVPAALSEGVARLRAECAVPDAFAPEVENAAEQAAAAPRLPTLDLTDVAFVTIDPAGSTDLDQAVHLERRGDGFRVRYAIADVAAFIAPGDPIDVEAHRRGQTFYAPHGRTPLHPVVLSEGAASLLAEQVRPALVWTIDLDATGERTAADVRRALVRSREQLSYPEAQRRLDDGSADASLALLPVVGALRQQREIERGGISLSLPDQDVVAADGTWRIEFRALLPVEEFNAQISLLTGMAAADLMLGAGIGVLRTLPPATEGAVRSLRATAAALGIDWPATTDYPTFVRSLDPRASGRHAAMMQACTTLFRGAGYVAFDGAAPEQPVQAALAAPYAHTTAPLRRLVDRYVGEICVAVCAGASVPEWVRASLPTLPEEMKASDARAKAFERGLVNLAEALVLDGRVGETLTGTVVALADAKGDAAPTSGTFVLAEPAVEARVHGAGFVLGATIPATLTEVDVARGVVEFTAGVSEPPAGQKAANQAQTISEPRPTP